MREVILKRKYLFSYHIFNQMTTASGPTHSDYFDGNLTIENPEFTSDYCFAIEGNIGCGKSTFLSLLRESLPEAKWIEEPVSEWQNLGGKNINIL